MVERGTENPGVSGSIPLLGTILRLDESVRTSIKEEGNSKGRNESFSPYSGARWLNVSREEVISRI